MEQGPDLALQMLGITKRFGDFTANDGIDLDVRKGEVHAILGENGAGKSTLMNICYGLLRPTEGRILIDGQEAVMRSPNDAIARGIGMVHQHFMLIQPFTVLENIILGDEPVYGLNQIDQKQARARIATITEMYGLKIDPDEKIQSISVGMQQRVEIIKALYRGAEILILDEPTAVLTPQEIQELGAIIRNLSSEGKSVVIITHKLHEIKQMADRCTIIRRGKKIGCVDVASVTEAQLASMMVGREVTMKVPKGEAKPGEVALSIQNLRVKNAKGLMAVNDLNLALRKGEILGIAGVDGNGQTELIEAITGLRSIEGGTIRASGIDISRKRPRQVLDAGVAHIPEDRQKRGLVMDFSVEYNMIIERFTQPPFSKKGVLNRPDITAYSEKLIAEFDIRPPNPTLTARSLSGGNQQKVIIAREVAGDPDVLIAAQPTRGLDVGAIEYVHRALAAQRDAGRAVLLISFELDEIMNLADRIAVIFDGRIVGELDAADADETEIGLMMAGGEQRGR